MLSDKNIEYQITGRMLKNTPAKYKRVDFSEESGFSDSCQCAAEFGKGVSEFLPKIAVWLSEI